jgi:ssDNA-binding Zn-finger/Zn-ribbon topoisomerase 1
MAIVQSLPLTCPKCRKESQVSVGRLQETNVFECPHCHATAGFDKDDATRRLAALELGSAQRADVHRQA